MPSQQKFPSWIVRHAYRPIRLTQTDTCEFEVFNTTAFTPGSDFLMKIRISNGRQFEFVPSAGPLSKEKVNFDLGDISGDCFLTADTYDKTGRLVSTEQICLNEEILTDVQPTQALPGWFKLENGRPTVNLGDKTMAPSDIYTILFRAETDNDSINFVAKPMRKWYKQRTDLIGSKQKKDRAVAEWAIRANHKTFLCTDVYEPCKDGVLVCGHAPIQSCYLCHHGHESRQARVC